MSTEANAQQEMFAFATQAEPEPTPAPSPEPTPAPSPEPAPSPAPAEDRDSPIPSWRLREESENRRLAEERARQLQARLDAVEAHRQQQQGQKTPAPDWFVDPAAAMQAAMQEFYRPIQAEQHRVLMQMSRDMAEYRHGAENVALAEKVFLEARDKRILDPMDYQRVIQAPNRYDAVVQWYKRLYALHTVGEDPNAWWEKQFETRMADPKFQAQVMEKIRGAAAARPAETKLPPSLSRATAAAPNGGGTVGDMSHDSMWAFATK